MRRTARPRVTVVDDDPCICKLLHAYLTDCGYEVRVHSGGQSAIDSLAHERPDAILLDLQMPAPNGLAVLAALQSVVPQTPVIVLSGSSDITQVATALRLGAWDYLTKPAPDLERVHHAIEVALKRAEIARHQVLRLQEGDDDLTAAQARSDELTAALARAAADNEAIRRQNLFLQNVLAATRTLDHALTYQVNPAGELTYVSEAFRNIGHAPASLLGRPVLDLIHPDDRPLANHRLTERRVGERATRRLALRLLPGPATSASQLCSPSPQVLLWAEGLYTTDSPTAMAYAGAVGTMMIA